MRSKKRIKSTSDQLIMHGQCEKEVRETGKRRRGGRTEKKKRKETKDSEKLTTGAVTRTDCGKLDIDHTGLLLHWSEQGRPGHSPQRW